MFATFQAVVVHIKGDEEDGACGMYTGLCGTSEGKRA
jgi:hypothetical protein